jgi:hypothetical protein
MNLSHDFEISRSLIGSHKVCISLVFLVFKWQVHLGNMHSVASAYWKYVPGAKTTIQTECQTVVAKSWPLN